MIENFDANLIYTSYVSKILLINVKMIEIYLFKPFGWDLLPKRCSRNIFSYRT